MSEPKVKRSRTVLSYDDKLQIIDQVEGGVPQKDVAERLKVAKSTVSQIIKNKAEVAANAAMAGPSKRVCKPLLDEEVLAWLTVKRSRGLPVTGQELCARARVISRKISGNDSFKVSTFKMFVTC